MHLIKEWWLDLFEERTSAPWLDRKRELFKQREAVILKISGDGRMFEQLRADRNQFGKYLMHLTYFIKQKDFYYIEEELIPMQFEYRGNEIHEHKKIALEPNEDFNLTADLLESRSANLPRFTYNRLDAVRYAERWWNDFNPQFRVFNVNDCTNYISQCLLAGGAPMTGAPNRSKGWWYGKDNWSFSWSVAHSFRWHLSGSRSGLTAKEVERAEDLIPGDVICYDFEGDNRWDHNTIVVNKDAAGMPLVNAHTNNSRNRYWEYKDSAAWTPNCKYKFFRIGPV